MVWNHNLCGQRFTERSCLSSVALFWDSPLCAGTLIRLLENMRERHEVSLLNQWNALWRHFFSRNFGRLHYIKSAQSARLQLNRRQISIREILDESTHYKKKKKWHFHSFCAAFGTNPGKEWLNPHVFTTSTSEIWFLMTFSSHTGFIDQCR